MGILEREISIYNGVTDKVGKIATLRDFLQMATEYQSTIEKLRATNDIEERKYIKTILPQATISGIFRPTRKAENLYKHSGLICVDFDAKDNQTFAKWNQLKEILSRYEEVGYISRSVSGNGYFAILPIKYANYHRQHFEQLFRDFREIGLNIDVACKDVSRLRCISLDLQPYINEEAKEYNGKYIEQHKAIFVPRISRNNIMEHVEECCKQIAATHTDITNGYNAWFEVGAALATLGEAGRYYFHICSQQNEKYKEVESDRKFTQLLRTAHDINIGTFFHICNEYGINYKL
jgi:hypothetical protein